MCWWWCRTLWPTLPTLSVPTPANHLPHLHMRNKEIKNTKLLYFYSACQRWLLSPCFCLLHLLCLCTFIALVSAYDRSCKQHCLHKPAAPLLLYFIALVSADYFLLFLSFVILFHCTFIALVSAYGGSCKRHCLHKPAAPLLLYFYSACQRLLFFASVVL